MQRTMKLSRNERGATLALVALMIFMFLGLGALTLDYGMIKSAEAEAQRAADASALAGGSALIDASLQTDAERAVEAVARARENVAQQRIRHVFADSTPPNFEVYADPANDTVGTVVSRPDVGLWFGRLFGINSMGITAHAVVKAEPAPQATTCLMPVAIPDMWDNSATRDLDTKQHPLEDLNHDGIWNYKDANSNGVVDEGEWEPWSYDPKLGDSYDPAKGYGSDFRNRLGSGNDVKVDDYGRTIMIQPFSPKDNAISSYYQAWGRSPDDVSETAQEDHIRNGLCIQVTLDEYYEGNGAKVPVGNAWDDRIASAPSADWTWDPVNNVPICGASACPDNWIDISPRVVTVAMYDPTEVTGPSDNKIKFNNLARIFLDKRCPNDTKGVCKNPVTAHFLGFVSGLGAGGGDSNGSLVLTLRLIK